MGNALERAAFENIERGWSVIPLRFSGEDRKLPLLETWKEYQERVPTKVEVLSWWRKWPNANLGTVTGKISSLVGVDLDGPNCSELLKQQGVFLPRTAAVQTQHGYHGYFLHPGNGLTISNRVGLLKDGSGSKVDIRGDGGYLVSPPSVHASGRVYQWVLPPSQGIAPLPDELLALLEKEQGESNARASWGEDWISNVIDGVDDGQRNDAAAALAGYFLRLNNCHEQSAYFSMRAWNALNRPPLEDDELRKVIASIAGRERRRLEQEAKKSPGYTRLEVLDGPA